MEISVHVGVGERAHVLSGVLLLEGEVFVAGGGFRLVEVLLVRLVSDGRLDFFESEETGLISF